VRIRSFPARLSSACAALLALLVAASAFAQSIEPGKLPGLIVDDSQAKRTGKWSASTNVAPYVKDGYIHARGEPATLRFAFRVPAAGSYHVLFAYTATDNRSTKTPVTLATADGEKTVRVNQQKQPGGPYVFADLGRYRFADKQQASLVVSTEGADGYVIADAVAVLTSAELKQLRELAKQRPVVATKENNKSKAKPAPQPVAFERIPPSGEVEKLTPAELDALLSEELGPVEATDLLDDERFLVRASLDVIGRQPTRAELQAFLDDPSPDRRAAAVDRLLAQSEYGENWGEYWADVIAHRTPKPQLTFLDYRPLEAWLAEQFNAGRGWDSIVFRLLTARGKVAEHPAATFLGFHQGNKERIAGETSRIFLGVKIACAECHDHPFIDMPQETFHGFAAFFARTEAKVAQLHSDQITVTSKTKGEHKMPGGKGEMQPVAFSGAKEKVGAGDMDRRLALARWITAGDNPYFARALVNRIWARLMGRGFCEPVDEIGDAAIPVLPGVHARVAEHFVASECDVRAVFRLVLNTRAYQRRLAPHEPASPFAAAVARKLRGDEIFRSLVTAIELPNIEPPRTKKTGINRFPPPPKTTKDLVDEAFGYDPSMKDEMITRTMKQAMFLMNNEQVQAQIDASPGSETFLAKLVAEEKDDERAITRLFESVLSRRPSEAEKNLVLRYVEGCESRTAAFEDLLWSLINSAEFTTRR